MTQLTPDTNEMLESLRAAVAETLDRKRRLGQYVVVWENDRPVFIGDDAPTQQNDKQNVRDQESR